MALSRKTIELMKQYTKDKPNSRITIGISANDRQQYYTYGQNGEMTPLMDRLYEIGSATKAFTTSILCKNLASGSISLSDTIDKYIRNLPKGLYYPTILQLATHFSGYGTFEEDLIEDSRKQNLFAVYDHDYLLKKVIQSARKPINGKWEYSNAAFSVLGHILGIVNGGTYQQVMKAFIEQDLKITGMQYGRDFTNSIHGFDGETDCGNWLWPESCPYAPAGCLSASVVDLMQFTRIHLYKELPYLDIGHQIHAVIDEHGCMGLGWILDTDDHITWHNGGTGRFNSFAGFHVQSQVAVVVLMNDYVDEGNSVNIANSIFEDFVDFI